MDLFYTAVLFDQDQVLLFARVFKHINPRKNWVLGTFRVIIVFPFPARWRYYPGSGNSLLVPPLYIKAEALLAVIDVRLRQDEVEESHEMENEEYDSGPDFIDASDDQSRTKRSLKKRKKKKREREESSKVEPTYETFEFGKI